ncbi:hypothetical protein GIB67_015624 [Kingdonia uniflora]|uniref:Uncharacterized protein n=1 Tax=Kingdonia uniflora TaxID=39325 RepID=A0A7J7NUL8_9MAGN|nr:hypothetical protein GIB67_015624 [Kingdonia uniflora]
MEPFNVLVKLVARACYNHKYMKDEKELKKTGRSDNRGLAVVVLDALTRRQWVREEDLAKDLKLQAKQLRHSLLFFEKEKYTDFDLPSLVSPIDGCFRCENCNEELVNEEEKCAVEETGDKGNVPTRKRRPKEAKDMLEKMELQLKPLMEHLNRIRDLTVSQFETLQEWERRANAVFCDHLLSSQGQGYREIQIPFLDEMNVKVTLSGIEVKEEDVNPDAETM